MLLLNMNDISPQEKPEYITAEEIDVLVDDIPSSVNGCNDESNGELQPIHNSSEPHTPNENQPFNENMEPFTQNVIEPNLCDDRDTNMNDKSDDFPLRQPTMSSAENKQRIHKEYNRINRQSNQKHNFINHDHDQSSLTKKNLNFQRLSCNTDPHINIRLHKK
ncbi:uncharacterized protein LOC106640607 [Copidosoma floridanum]|uniref:uncharacterized protein LOC106640607 n=1 Tax=Copidosoma floridanum TaxID=29053 RepID=UPI0006C97FF1|nr:uncharacterized protein LOC106640607 [Copidosoma floridanum]